ncbi:hypothetical protein L3Q82_019284, partial [Scortum barcoo]
MYSSMWYCGCCYVPSGHVQAKISGSIVEMSSFGTTEMRPCCFRMTWLCWFHQTVTFSTHWGSLQPSVKRSGGGSEAMVHCWKEVGFSFWFGSELLPHAKEFLVSCSEVR